MIENMKVRRFKEEDAQEVRNLIVRNFLEVNSKDYGISAMEKLAKAYNAEKVLNVASYAHMYVFEFDGKIIGTGSILWIFGCLNMMERLIWAMLQRMKWHRLLG